MSWKTLIGSLIQHPMEGSAGWSCPEQIIKDVLDAGPAVYWYSGSGDDLVPLVLDMPQNPTGRRLFPQRGTKQGKPLLLWMNDYQNSLAGFPYKNQFNIDLGNVQATVEIEQSPCRFVIPVKGLPQTFKRKRAIPLTLFQVRVKNKPPKKGMPGRYVRSLEGDIYTVFYSPVESEILLRSVFAAHEISVEVVAIIKQEGHFDRGGLPFSKQNKSYQIIPKLMQECADQIGKVQAYLVDKDCTISGYEIKPHSPQIPDWGCGVVRMWEPLNSVVQAQLQPNLPQPSAWAQLIRDTISWKQNPMGNPPQFTTVIRGRPYKEDGTVYTDIRTEEENIIWSCIREEAKMKVLDHGCGMGRHCDFIRNRRSDAELWGTEADQYLLSLCQDKHQVPQFRQSLDEVSQHGYNLILLLGNNVGIFGSKAATIAGMKRLYNMLWTDGVLIGEFHPLPDKEYSCEQLEVRYGQRTSSFQWGFMQWNWLRQRLVDIGFRVDNPISSLSGQASIFTAVKSSPPKKHPNPFIRRTIHPGTEPRPKAGFGFNGLP